MRHIRTVLLGILFTGALGVGCGPTDPSGNDGGQDAGQAPVIITNSVGDARVGGDYQQALAVEGGLAPMQWSLEEVSESLGWLKVGASTGQLSGLPTAVVNPPATFKVRVRDSLERTAVRDFSLLVKSCQSGDEVACSFNDGTACMVGVKSCTSGQFGPCNGGRATDTVEQCGADCGACGESATSCQGGRCKCGEGGDPCSGDQPTCCSTGGERICADLQNDLLHCGACGNNCLDGQPAGTVADCEGSICVYPCQAGFAHCPTDADFCVDLNTEEGNCGGCGHSCPAVAPLNAEYVDAASAPRPPDQFCQLGQCDLSCKDGFASCDNEIETSGCEVNTTNDVNHCGGCDNKCGGKPHAIGYDCTGGDCRITACEANWDDCNKDYADGCEVDLTSDEAHCGACGTVCSLPNASSVCTNRVCEVTACSSGFNNCDNDSRDGCETQGPCNVPCGGSVCSYPETCEWCEPPKGCPISDPSCGWECCQRLGLP